MAVVPNAVMLQDQKGVGFTVLQSIAPAFLGREHRFKDDAMEPEEPSLTPSTDVTQRLASSMGLVKRVRPLPRYEGSVVMVDHELRNYQVNPRNTILVPDFVDYDERDDALLTVVAFARLFHSLYKRKEARTASDALEWLHQRHPDIAINPYRMGEYIREESSAIGRELELLERNSLGAVAKDVAKKTLIGSGRAITPQSTRLTIGDIEDGTLLEARVLQMKRQQAKWQAKQEQAARKAAEGGEL
jgi:hypothetical protein